MGRLPLVLMDNPHEVVQQFALLAYTEVTVMRGSVIQKPFHAPKQSRRTFEGNEIRVKPAHV